MGIPIRALGIYFDEGGAACGCHAYFKHYFKVFYLDCRANFYASPEASAGLICYNNGLVQLTFDSAAASMAQSGKPSRPNMSDP